MRSTRDRNCRYDSSSVSCPARLHRLAQKLVVPALNTLMKPTCAMRNLCVLPQESIWRHGDTSTCPILLSEISGRSIPDDLDRICLLFSPVAVPENKASRDIDFLEYQLQIIMRSSR